MRHGSWVQTYTGEKFWPLDPRPEEIHIGDIAHSLSLICRYNGHVDRFYSVAEHSVLLSEYVSDENKMWALMHDSAEAYVGDMTRPLKKHMHQFRAAENRILYWIAQKFDLPGKDLMQDRIPREVLDADTRILLTERKELMSNTRHQWEQEHIEPLPVKIRALSPQEAKEAFLERFFELGGSNAQY